ncbi:hypothetical protein TUM4438_04330 [Shewanella sairae]|uniref:Uncharacterized protein n=1 Tax=Shewanella sairae TaxID=190310 RepID=A0ABQ4P0X3_9GAMM|nr:hypothetical protein TUM4438_04330 [Shewanella sairae]
MPNDANDSGIRLIKKPEAIAKNDKPATGTNVLFLYGLQAEFSTSISYRLILFKV